MIIGNSAHVFSELKTDPDGNAEAGISCWLYH